MNRFALGLVRMVFVGALVLPFAGCWESYAESYTIRNSREYLEACRGGDFSGLASLQLRLKDGSVSYQDIETTPEEIVQFEKQKQAKEA